MPSINKNHFGDKLFETIRKKENFLCLGIDPHLDLIPKVFQKKIKLTNDIYSKNNIKIVESFCIKLIETIADLVPAIKLQIAFFEQLGPEGFKLLSKLCHLIKENMSFVLSIVKEVILAPQIMHTQMHFF